MTAAHLALLLLLLPRSVLPLLLPQRRLLKRLAQEEFAALLPELQARLPQLQLLLPPVPPRVHRPCRAPLCLLTMPGNIPSSFRWHHRVRCLSHTCQSLRTRQVLLHGAAAMKPPKQSGHRHRLCTSCSWGPLFDCRGLVFLSRPPEGEAPTQLPSCKGAWQVKAGAAP